MNPKATKFLDRAWVVPSIAAFLAVGATLGILGNGWTLDADVDITSNRLVTGQGTLAELLTSDYVAGSGMRSGFWRPMVGLFYWILWRLGGGEPFLFFLVNLLLHAGISAGVGFLARRFEASSWAALAASALFAVHPVHTDVIAGVVGLKDLLAASGFLFGLLFLLSGRAAFSMSRIGGGCALFLAGILSKESALALIPALLLLDLGELRRERSTWRILGYSYAGLLGAVILKFGLQRFLLGATLEGVRVHPGDNPLIQLSPLEARFHALEIVPLYVRLLFWPHPLSPDYSYNSLPLGTSAFSSGILLGGAILAFLVTALFWAWRRKEKLLFAGLALFLAGYLPVSNLLMILGTNAAERFLYLPSIGFCLVVAWLLSRPRLPQRLAWAFFLVTTLAGLVKSEFRNRDWRDRNTLWSASFPAVPGNRKLAIGLAQQCISRGEAEEAIAIVHRAMEQDDPDPRTRPVGEMYRAPLLAVEGTALIEMGRLDEAYPVLKKAVTLAPDNVLARFHFGRLLHRLGDPSAAREQFEIALLHHPTEGQRQWIAEEEQAIRITQTSPKGPQGIPGEAMAHLLASDRRYRSHDLAGAIGELKAALKLVPDNFQARLNLGILLLQDGKPVEAEAELRGLVSVDPRNPIIWFHLGVALKDQGRGEEARGAWKRALEQAAPGDPLAQEVQREMVSLSPPPR